MDSSLLQHSQELYVHHYVVLDQQPDGTVPTMGTIFQGVSPWLYSVQHDIKRRFIIKRRWTQRLTLEGSVSNVMSIGPSAHAVDALEYFDRGINVRTDWKNNTTGQYRDVEKGALLWIGVVSSSIPDQVEPVPLEPEGEDMIEPKKVAINKIGAERKAVQRQGHPV
ncbi:Geminivirus MSV 27Kd coat protein [Parasponia andersonii]|uniref:Geminivirus MSV 27Kd coat protein n=1 Tax=Parasponia andersonii TaxID=3476 RepID=A0A2P5DBG1_PARAD|nr:Geminivirus MSV 27Kd coat protein [Parasponia andersonii]